MLAACGGLLICASAFAADLQHHRSALPADIQYEPYSHRRVVRWQGQRQVARRAETHKQDFGNFENPFVQTPCNATMFRAPGGGLTAIEGLTVQKWRYIPGKIRTYLRNTPINGTTEHAVYPLQTRFAETIAHNGRVFEVRCIHKGDDGKWEFDIDTVGPVPPGYETVTDCRGCHKFAGADSHQMPTVDNQRWWGYGRNIGDDMILSHDPWQMRNARLERWSGN